MADPGPALTVSRVSRGLAAGDLDQDGDLDLVVVDQGTPARILLNRGADGRPWLGLRLVDATGRDAHLARAELLRDGQPPLVRIVQPSAGFAGASDPRVLFPLPAAQPATVRVTWPGGRVEEWKGLAPGGYRTLVEGTAPAPDADPPG